MRILFMAEGVTLAHVARPLVLAKAAVEAGHEVAFACDARYDQLLTDLPCQRLTINSVSPAQFSRALARGAPLYKQAELEDYVETDKKLISALKPDLVVGDFRLSLSVSARLLGVRYASIANAYWSPYFSQQYTVPTLPISRYLPIPLAQALFDLGRPLAFAYHTLPLNRVRMRHGLPSLGCDLRRVYTDADMVFYPDLPEQFPGIVLPDNHHFIGPILWSPPMPTPEWWDLIEKGQPVIYATPGSSGDRMLLSRVLIALKQIPVTVIAASAGGSERLPCGENQFVADYLPGIAAAERSCLVICNGGSPTCQQALAAGVPVIGVASNLDQFLNLQTLTEMGVAVALRADRLSIESIRIAVSDALINKNMQSLAKDLKQKIQQFQAPERFLSLLVRGYRD